MTNPLGMLLHPSKCSQFCFQPQGDIHHTNKTQKKKKHKEIIIPSPTNVLIYLHLFFFFLAGVPKTKLQFISFIFLLHINADHYIVFQNQILFVCWIDFRQKAQSPTQNDTALVLLVVKQKLTIKKKSYFNRKLKNASEMKLFFFFSFLHYLVIPIIISGETFSSEIYLI